MPTFVSGLRKQHHRPGGFRDTKTTKHYEHNNYQSKRRNKKTNNGRCL